MIFNGKTLAFIALIAFTSTTLAQGYDITRVEETPFSFSISGVNLNEGSSLMRESILFNDPTSPVTLKSHNTTITYKDRAFNLNAETGITVSKLIKALEVRTAMYDIFGQHMKNLANSEAKDYAAGDATLTGVWRARDNDTAELLTTVTYVARVRFEDGTQWVFNRDNLQLALSTLRLEKKIDEDEDK